jgi:hypothetical protein
MNSSLWKTFYTDIDDEAALSVESFGARYFSAVPTVATSNRHSGIYPYISSGYSLDKPPPAREWQVALPG